MGGGGGGGGCGGWVGGWGEGGGGGEQGDRAIDSSAWDGLLALKPFLNTETLFAPTHRRAHLVLVADSFSHAGMGIPCWADDRTNREPPFRHAVARSAGSRWPMCLALPQGAASELLRCARRRWMGISPRFSLPVYWEQLGTSRPGLGPGPEGAYGCRGRPPVARWTSLRRGLSTTSRMRGLRA